MSDRAALVAVIHEVAERVRHVRGGCPAAAGIVQPMGERVQDVRNGSAVLDQRGHGVVVAFAVDSEQLRWASSAPSGRLERTERQVDEIVDAAFGCAATAQDVMKADRAARRSSQSGRPSDAIRGGFAGAGEPRRDHRCRRCWRSRWQLVHRDHEQHIFWEMGVDAPDRLVQQVGRGACRHADLETHRAAGPLDVLKERLELRRRLLGKAPVPPERRDRPEEELAGRLDAFVVDLDRHESIAGLSQNTSSQTVLPIRRGSLTRRLLPASSSLRARAVTPWRPTALRGFTVDPGCGGSGPTRRSVCTGTFP